MGIFDRASQLRFRRFVRRKRRNLESVAERLDDSFENDVLNRAKHIPRVWRFVMSWTVLILVVAGLTISQTFGLAKLYQQERPVAGGVYNEGQIGSFSNINPLYASSAVDNAASRLVFAGLMKLNEKNELVPDMAKSLAIDESGKNYTLKLRDNIRWHDGKPLTAEDVIYTFTLIQNPDADSFLRTSWQGIKVTKLDRLTVRFTLPTTLAPFKYSLTTGIVPKHILQNVPIKQLRANVFNSQSPVGSGPYKWVGLNLKDPAADAETSILAFAPFEQYYAGKPSLDRFLIHTYNTDQALAKAFENNDVMAAAGLTSKPESFRVLETIRTYAFRMTAEMMVFFKTTEGVLSDVKVRQALVRATYRVDMGRNIPDVYRPVRGPLLPEQVGYDRAYEQALYNPSEAQKMLDDAGWKVGDKGIRYKDGKPLLIRIYAEDTPTNQKVLAKIKKSWSDVGVDLRLEVQQNANFQTTINLHSYEALLYGISIGPDPDVYAYWHSTRADVRSSSRLNFSEYKSKAADTGLEGGRTRLEPEVRKQKYQAFLKAWQEDAPAIALYQPRQFYYVRGTVYGLQDATINTDADRYNNVANWKIHTAGVTED